MFVMPISDDKSRKFFTVAYEKVGLPVTMNRNNFFETNNQHKLRTFKQEKNAVAYFIEFILG